MEDLARFVPEVKYAGVGSGLWRLLVSSTRSYSAVVSSAFDR